MQIDDLQWGGLKIIQSKDKFCFGTDAVLLANFFEPAGESTVCDFGSGTGILSILIGGKNRNIKVHAVEIQKELAEMSAKSCVMNGLDNIKVHHGDIKDVTGFVPRCTSVICNPPYEKINTGKLPQNESHKVSRYEVLIDFDGIALSAAKLLGDGGKFYFIHKASRLGEITKILGKNNFSIKTLRFIHPFADKEANLVLVCAAKNRKDGLRIMPPLIIHDETGEYTQELKEIYRPYKGEI